MLIVLIVARVRHMESYNTHELTGGVGMCNAVRRALISDVQTWAPCRVTIRRNTSCETDEFLAHRIGLVPLCQADAACDCVLTLRASGPRTVFTRELVGARARPIFENVPIIILGDGQELDLDVHIDRQQASVHPRYAPCGSVGMEPHGPKGCHRIRFRGNDDRTPEELLRNAFEALEGRLADALHQLAHQPTTPPKDMS